MQLLKNHPGIPYPLKSHPTLPYTTRSHPQALETFLTRRGYVRVRWNRCRTVPDSKFHIARSYFEAPNVFVLLCVRCWLFLFLFDDCPRIQVYRSRERSLQHNLSDGKDGRTIYSHKTWIGKLISIIMEAVTILTSKRAAPNTCIKQSLGSSSDKGHVRRNATFWQFGRRGFLHNNFAWNAH